MPTDRGPVRELSLTRATLLDGAASPVGFSLAGIDVAQESVIQGTVVRDGAPVRGAYVRLLDTRGEFTAEVPTSAVGQFRFFARPGTWTVRAHVAGAAVERPVLARLGEVAEVDVEVDIAV